MTLRYRSTEVNFYIAILFLFVAGFNAANAGGNDKKFQIRNFTKNQYGAAFQNWSLDEDSEGYMYTANHKGLLVYDGLSWELHTREMIRNLRAVAYDPQQNRIYTAGYRNLGYWQWDSLSRLHYTSLIPVCENHINENEEFWDIAVEDDQVVFQSFRSIFVYRDDTMRVIREHDFYSSISTTGRETFVHVRNEGVFKLQDTVLTPFLTPDFFADKFIMFMLPWEEGYLLGTSKHGIFYHDGKTITVFFPDCQDFFIKNTIKTASLYNDSTLLVGTIQGGIIGLSTSGSMFTINENNGLQNNTILDLHCGATGVWAALDRGLTFIRSVENPSCEIHSFKKTGASYSAAIFRDSLYLGTNQGLYRKACDEPDEQFNLVEGTQDQVWDCRIMEGTLLIGHNAGTFAIDETGISKISDISGGFHLIKHPQNEHKLFQCTYSRIVMYEKSHAKWRVSGYLKNFSELIRYIEMDYKENIWVSHMHRGIYKLRLNEKQDSVIKKTYYGKESVFKQEYGIHVFKVDNQVVFTTGERVYTYDGIHDTIIPYKQLNAGLKTFRTAHRIIPASNHHYWFITREAAGLFKIKAQHITLLYNYPSSIFDHQTIDGFENIVPLTEKTAIYCLANGYAFLNADDDTEQQKMTSSLKLRSISLEDRGGDIFSLPAGRKLYRVPYSKNSIRLRYAYPSHFQEPVHLQYQVTGLKPGFSDPVFSPEIYLNRIPSGEYVIKVYAENKWNERSQPHLVNLKVFSPWYLSSVALIVYLFLLTLSILYVRYRAIKRTKKQEQKLREHKEQELIKLRNHNLQTKLDFKSRELANSTMAIIKKNEFLLELKEILRVHKAKLGSRYPDKFYNSALQKINKNISGGDEWKVFETNLENAHEAFIQQLIKAYPDLTQSDLRFCTYLRMNLSSKEISSLMKISVRGVENHRYRLRKKFNLARHDNLNEFMLTFGEKSD